MLLTPAQIKQKSFESRWNSFFFFTWGGCVLCLHVCLGARLLPQFYQYPNLLEGADRISGQLCRDKECSFSGITKSGKVWRKVPENGARSVIHHYIYIHTHRQDAYFITWKWQLHSLLNVIISDQSPWVLFAGLSISSSCFSSYLSHSTSIWRKTRRGSFPTTK